ncbi:MAG: hypothetical protein HPY71_01555 [Firmicutes bacterium]|nr:hypothetical protein [Bacillota bacterium]
MSELGVSSWIQAIASVVLVCVTIKYVIDTNKLVRSSVQPIITIEDIKMDLPPKLPDITIRNSGHGPALNIYIEFTVFEFDINRPNPLENIVLIGGFLGCALHAGQDKTCRPTPAGEINPFRPLSDGAWPIVVASMPEAPMPSIKDIKVIVKYEDAIGTQYFTSYALKNGIVTHSRRSIGQKRLQGTFGA